MDSLYLEYATDSQEAMLEHSIAKLSKRVKVVRAVPDAGTDSLPNYAYKGIRYLLLVDRVWFNNGGAIEVAKAVPNYVAINFGTHDGITTNGAPLGVLPTSVGIFPFDPAGTPSYRGVRLSTLCADLPVYYYECAGVSMQLNPMEVSAVSVHGELIEVSAHNYKLMAYDIMKLRRYAWDNKRLDSWERRLWSSALDSTRLQYVLADIQKAANQAIYSELTALGV